MKKLLLLSFIMLTMFGGSGCIKNNRVSYSGLDDPNAVFAAESVANDAANTLAGKYAPGHTTFSLMHPEKGSAFGGIFENALRAKGFSISYGGTRLWYVADFIDASLLYLSVNLADGFGFNCVYDVNAEAGTVRKQGESTSGAQ